MKKTLVLLSVILLGSLRVFAQSGENTAEKRNGFLKEITYAIRAGINIGGTSPLPVPAEIRSIESYNPTLSFSLGANANKMFSERWGMQLGAYLEDKGMKTHAQVKQYQTSIVGYDGERKSGYWTGHVRTKVLQSSLTVPVLATYNISPRVRLKAGPYVSWVMEKEFSGTVFDGYLREDTPTGNKMEITGDNEAMYEFSKDMRNFQWGMQVGTEWKAYQHLLVFGEVSWGANNIFKSDFHTITFNMYPIYATIGFGYAF